MTIVDALKELAKTITGNDVSGETIAELLDRINEDYTGGGFGVEFTQTGNVYSTETSIADIYAAAMAKKKVYGYIIQYNDETPIGIIKMDLTMAFESVVVFSAMVADLDDELPAPVLMPTGLLGTVDDETGEDIWAPITVGG